MSFFDEVYKVCLRIPKGKVTIYGQIAIFLGKPRAARQAGWVMCQASSEKQFPWHRVLNGFGHLCENLSFGGKQIQRQLLEQDDVKIENDIVDLSIYLWIPQ